LFIDYRYFDAKEITPTFEFGFGLSYTSFKYSNLSINSVNTTVLYQVEVTVTNTGGVDGHEVPQLYIGFPESTGEPPKVLRGFDRVWIEAGQSITVTFDLSPLEMSVWNVDTQQWEVPSGKFQVFVGASSRDIRLSGSLINF
jgi:beta-glucosidase